ncbi:MAG: hypothetical protein KF746_14280 [Chitinophagaceae bacterium]|nr:hypothetical protein [Chitinophagaceae bacterium]
MNILAYIIYFLLTYLITVHAGLSFYRNGKVYVLQLLNGDQALSAFINKMLLTGYYLLNLGYAALSVHSWNTIGTWTQLIAIVITLTGRIMLILAVIHFINMLAVFLFSKYRNQFSHHKTFYNET